MQFINNLLDSFITYSNSIEHINQSLTNKKIRQPNFPSEISENIVCYYLNKMNISATWDTDKGDIEFSDGKRIEVKAFSSDGPSSFGPKENWDIIYFVDCKNYKQKYFTIYEIKLSNKSHVWANILINKTETYEKQCQQGKRPRISFELLQKQIPEYCVKVFEGNLSVI